MSSIPQRRPRISAPEKAAAHHIGSVDEQQHREDDLGRVLRGVGVQRDCRTSCVVNPTATPASTNTIGAVNRNRQYATAVTMQPVRPKPQGSDNSTRLVASRGATGDAERVARRVINTATGHRSHACRFRWRHFDQPGLRPPCRPHGESRCSSCPASDRAPAGSRVEAVRRCTKTGRLAKAFNERVDGLYQPAGVSGSRSRM